MSSLSQPKTIYLHIGHYKTGTSAVQDYLSAHARQLRSSGYLYPACSRPKNNPTNHGHLALSLGREHGFVPPPWYGEEVSVEEAFAELHATLAKATEPNVILSSEEFVQLALREDPVAAVAALKEQLARYDVKIVFYIREPMSLLKSWFNQVNKGPVGTANFPTFANRLNPEFLSQHAIWSHFSAAFGRESMILVTYKKVGSDHLREFLQAIGCAHQPPASLGLVNEAQPSDLLELIRLAKPHHGSYDDVTVSRIGSAERFAQKIRAISDGYDQIAAMSDEPRKSKLTPEAIFAHHAGLLRPLVAHGIRHQAEADNLRELALQAEGISKGFAHALMEAAQVIRPEGPLILRKLAEYRKALGL